MAQATIAPETHGTGHDIPHGHGPAEHPTSSGINQLEKFGLPETDAASPMAACKAARWVNSRSNLALISTAARRAIAVFPC